MNAPFPIPPKPSLLATFIRQAGPRRITALELALLNDPKHTKMGPLDRRHPIDKIASAMIRSGQPVVVGGLV